MQRVMRGYRYLAPRERARIERFRNEVERYVKDLDLAGFTGRQLSRTYTRRAVWRYAVREALSLLLGLPLALAGIANHLIPYQLTAAVVRRLKPDLDDEATWKVTAGVVLFPLHHRLRARRRALVDELAALARSVPESVLSGEPPGGKA
jgi:hypothetical protein